MTVETSALFFIAILIFAITPGPGVFAVLARSLAFGVHRSLAMIIGIVISDIVYLLMACKGLSYIAENWSQVFTIIRLASAVYLIYLGWKIWDTPVTFYLDETTNQANDHIKSFLQGFLISASNPKVILFYLAFLPTFMDLSGLTDSDLLLMGFLTFAGLSLALTIIAAGAAAARHYFQSESALGRLNKTAGATMIGAGAFLASRQ